MQKFFTSFISLLMVLTLVAPTTFATQSSEQSSVQVQDSIELQVSQHILSLTEIRTVDISVDFGETVDLDNLDWKFGGKSLSEWKKWDTELEAYSGEPFINIIEAPHYVDQTTTIEATLEFGLPYDTTDLSPRSIRVLYPELLGDYELVLSTDDGVEASTTVTLNVYDEFLQYSEIKPAIDNVFAEAEVKNDRYLEYKKLGESVQGRDIHFVILAKDEAAVKTYLDQTLPQALENPTELLKKIENGTIGDYQVPIWFNNIHPDEVEGVDSQVELLKKLALKDEVTFQTTDEEGTESTIKLDVNEVLDHIIFLFNFTHNPDGRVENTRANANGFDLNRDNAYQTQVETIAVNEELATWTPLSFIDGHGYVKGFLIEPATPPHNPNFEYDLLVDSMLDQAHAMGKAGVANSDVESYLIPLLDWGNGWDDMTPAYTAIFAMLHGSLGHTVEVPSLSQDSLNALVHASLGATNFVTEHKDELFKKQLQIFERGVNGEDNRAVDPFYVNQAGEEIGRVRGEHDNFFPEYYVIPVDKDQKNLLEATNMVDYLVRNGITVEQTTEDVTVGDKTFTKGSYLVPMNQAKRGLANAMLYKGDNVSDWKAMYDPIVVNFPALRGFDVLEVRVEDAFLNKTDKVNTVEKPVQTIDKTTDYQVVLNTNNDVVKLINKLLSENKQVQYIVEDQSGFNKGDFVVKTKDLLPHMNDYIFDTNPVIETPKVVELSQPKVAVTGSAQSKFTLKELGFTIVDEESATVIVDDAGAFNPKDLANKTLIGIGGRALAGVKEANLFKDFNYETTKIGHEGLLKSVVADHLVTSGYEADELLYTASGSWITQVPEESEVLAKVVNEDDFYVAGWWPGHEGVKGQTLAFTTKLGNSTITLFANDLAFRAHTQHSYRLLSNSLFASTIDKDQEAKFSDVPENFWAHNQIKTLYNNGLLNGLNVTNGKFKPNEAVNRGQAAELIASALDLQTSSIITEAPFKDVSIDSYYAPVATTVKEQGIFAGRPDGTFGPSVNLSREQMASVLVQAFNLQDTGEAVSLSDWNTVSNTHKENVKILIQHNITKVTTFRPKEAVNRAQFTVFLHRILSSK